MTEEMLELGRRALACKGWRWMPGMAWVEWRPGQPYHLHAGRMEEECSGVDPSELPDLTDPATLGCLDHLLVDAYGRKVVLTNGNGWWSVETDAQTWDDDSTASYAAALVSALEAAP